MDEQHLKRALHRRSTCLLCGGKGYTVNRVTDTSVIGSITDTATIVDCLCVVTSAKELQYVEANIPVHHRTWTMKELTEEFKEANKLGLEHVDHYIKNLDRNIRDGVGLWFFSMPGLGKSSIICVILQGALAKGYTARWEKAAKIVTLKFTAMSHNEDGDAAKETLAKILSADILAIEEIEKISVSNTISPGRNNPMAYQLFYEFLTDLYDTQKSLLVSSNKIRDEIEATLPHWVKDRMKLLVSVPFIGRSGRRDLRKRNTNAKSKLKTK
jgi:hypothetical protein